MSNRYRVLALVAAASLTGCSLIPDYQRPAAPVSAQWPQGPAYGPVVDGESAARIGWRDFFQSPQLQYVIETALAHNRDLRAAALNVEAARASYRVQQADLMPTIAAGAALSRQGVPEAVSATGRDMVTAQYSADIGISAFELDLFGRVRSLNERALALYLASEEGRNAVQIALIAETANAYLTLQADRKLLALTNDTLAAQEESYRLIKRRFDLGIGSQLDVSQALTQVESARANQALYKRLVAQDKNALTLLMGTPIDDRVLEAEGLDTVALMQDLPVGLPSEVLLARPDVREAEQRLIAANADIGAARAAFFPQITLTGAAGLASESLGDLFSSGAGLAWRFIPQITLPIFTGGRNMANLEAAEAREQIAVAQYEKAIQVAFREVADELAARGTFNDQLAAQRALVAASKTSYDLSNARYQQGIDSHLNALDAQRQLYAAQQGEIIVQRQRLGNLVNLYRVLGGGIME